MDAESARAILTKAGWLSTQPEWFQAEVLERAMLQDFAADEVIYRIGGPPGGIYGLVAGTLKVSTVRMLAAPRFIQFGIIGAWAGEGPYLTGEPRRSELRTVTPCTMMHLPLDEMNRLSQRNPQAIRCFASLTVTYFDVLTRIIDDLLIPRAEQRIASVLQRSGLLQSSAVPISQEELGMMANASRKQVNAAVAKFAARGWIRHTYRSIEVLDGAALLAFALKETR